MVKFNLFGHDTQEEDGHWVYSDDHEPVDFFNPRPCPKCGERMRADGCDPCIGKLPGVKAACCGHGKRNGYALFEDSTLVKGTFSKLG